MVWSGGCGWVVVASVSCRASGHDWRVLLTGLLPYNSTSSWGVKLAVFSHEEACDCISRPAVTSTNLCVNFQLLQFVAGYC